MLKWYSKHYKTRTINSPGNGKYRFVMPLYEEWINFPTQGGLDRFLRVESDYILSKKNEIWFAIENPKKGYLFRDNKTSRISYTSAPRMFYDSRIPIEKISVILKTYQFSDKKIEKHLSNLKEMKIDKLLERIS